jgi:transcriptional regulator with XRE-family HTH domain
MKRNPFALPESLGSVLRAFRAQHQLTPKALATRMKVDVARMRLLLYDATVPTLDEVHRLHIGLGIPVQGVLRHVQASAMALFEEALEGGPSANHTVAARAVSAMAPRKEAAVVLLPTPLRNALCDALGVARDDMAGLQAAWAVLAGQLDAPRTAILRGTAVQMQLEGEVDEPWPQP